MQQSQGQSSKDWEVQIEPYMKELRSEKGLCHLVEWIREDLPLETKEGGIITKECQAVLQQVRAPSAPTQEYFEEDDKKQGQASELNRPPLPAKENIIVFEDNHGFTKAVVSNAPEARIATQKVVEGPWDQYGMEEVRNIIGSKECSMIVFGATCDIPRSNSPEDILAFQTTVMQLAFYVVKCIVADELPVKKLCFLSRGVFEEGKELHGQVGLSLTTFATLFGFVNTARLEMEETEVMLIDTEYFLKPPFWMAADFKLSARLASEVWRNESFGVNTVRILNKGRYVARQLLADQRYSDADVEFELPEPGGIVGISGGNGSLGIIMAGWLVDQAEKLGKSGFEIQMLSRSCSITDHNMKPFKKVEEKAKRLKIAYVHKQCNISSQSAADEYVQSTDGRLFGLIHSAGILQDSMVPNMTWEKFEAVWNPKHRAAMFLHYACERIPNCLSFFWMFSSLAVYGNLGQLNYSSSNSAMDGLSRHRRALGKPAQTMQWGSWLEAGMAANLDAGNKRRMEMGPYPPFSNIEGLIGLENGLKCNVPNFSVYKMNPQAIYKTIKDDKSTTDSYNRNFTSEFVPPPPSADASFNRPYSVYKSFLFPQAWSPNCDMLTFHSYVAPLIGQEEGADMRTL